MNDIELKQAYNKIFDDVHASDELRERVLSLKHKKRAITPFKATIGTIAAAVMIFAAVNEYGFVEDPEGVISQTIVSTQMPQTEISAIKPESTPVPPTVKATKAPAVAKNVQTVAPETAIPKSDPTPMVVVATEPDTSGNEVSVAAHTNEYEPASYGGKTVSGADAETSVQTWEISRYYNYIGADIGALINASYTGAQAFEITVDANGVPTDDMIALTYICENGGTVRVTVSRTAFFDEQLSGTVREAGNGCSGYKVSVGGVYYQVYTTGMSIDETQNLISRL